MILEDAEKKKTEKRKIEQEQKRSKKKETKTGCGNHVIVPENFMRDYAGKYCRVSVIIVASFTVLLPLPLLPKISLCACVYMPEKIGKGKRIRTGDKTRSGRS